MAGKKEEEDHKAIRLKSVAEEKYKLSNLKSALKYAKRAQRLSPDLDGISEMVTAFQILRVVSKKPSVGDGPPDWYKILQVEPFSHINSIKKQYKKLALTLHPDKNTCVASEEAFKHVGEAFRVLSDKIGRKDYDLKLRVSLQSQAAAAAAMTAKSVETFWTACSICRLFHQFERQYIGHRLMCPSCKKSFLAVEVTVIESEEDEAMLGVRPGVATRASARVYLAKKKVEDKRDPGVVNTKRKTSTTDSLESPHLKKMKTRGEMTLAEMQLEAKQLKMKMKEKINEKDNKGNGKGKGKAYERAARLRNPNLKMTVVDSDFNDFKKDGDKHRFKKGQEKMKMKEKTKEKEKEEKEKKKVKEMRVTSKIRDLEMLTLENSDSYDFNKNGMQRKSKRAQEKMRMSNRTKEIDKKEKEKEKAKGRQVVSNGKTLEISVVEDSDFNDFDKDRIERSLRKGQVWAVYDDDDGMPRLYGLIDEVVSLNPFEVKMSWLDPHNGDEVLTYWEKSGFHISCGRFKVARKTSINSVNIFSHLVECERVARELYMIYPKKGTVWAIYSEGALDSDERNLSFREKRCYDIVVFLTSYSDMHGLSMAYLEKVEGFKTTFKRREIGCHAISWLEKDDVRLFSHQIPARKLLGSEALGLPTDCWELDPASLPSIACIGWGR